MTDNQHARRLFNALDDLNEAISAAQNDGLRVSVEVMHVRTFGRKLPDIMLNAQIMRPIPFPPQPDGE